MSNLKVVLLILVAILVMSCNSNEPELYNGIVGRHQNGILNEDPTGDPDYIKEYNQAYLLYHDGKYDEALVAMRKIVEKYKNETTGSFDSPFGMAKKALVFMGRIIYEQTGSIDELRAMLEGYSQGDSRFAKFANFWRAVQYCPEEPHKAIEIWKGIKFGEEDAQDEQYRLLYLGDTYYMIGDKEEAYKYFRE